MILIKRWGLFLLLAASVTGCVQSCEPRSARKVTVTDSGKGPVDCGVVCKVGSETEKCLFLNVAVSRPVYYDRVKEIPKLFAEGRSTGRISKTDIMALFDRDNDACNRPSVDVSPSGEFSNIDADDSGCVYPYQSIVGDISLGLPAVVQGKFSKKDDGFTLEFKTKNKRPVISLENSALQQSYGGPVGLVQLKGRRVLAATSSACIAARL